MVKKRGAVFTLPAFYENVFTTGLSFSPGSQWFCGVDDCITNRQSELFLAGVL